MQETTIRAHAHDVPVKDHNEREEELIKKENAKQFKIDRTREYEPWKTGDEREAYQEIFGEALDEYNAKQKRKDRQMTLDEYIDNVRNDTRGRVKKQDIKKGITQRTGKATSYEMVVSVGNVAQEKDKNNRTVRNPDGSRSMPHRIDPAINKAIQKAYWDGFQERNPNFKLYAVDWHADEVFQDKTDKKYYPGTEHSHGRFVPFAGGYAKGLAVQSSVNKALAEMGFVDHYEPQPDGSRKWVCAYSAWTEREAQVMEEITKEFLPDIEITHPCAGLGLESKETEAFKAEKDLDEKIDSIQESSVKLDQQRLIKVLEYRILTQKSDRYTKDALDVVAERESQSEKYVEEQFNLLAELDSKCVRLRKNVGELTNKDAELTQQIIEKQEILQTLDARTASLNDRETLLNEREAELDAKEVELQKREKEVGFQEFNNKSIKRELDSRESSLETKQLLLDHQEWQNKHDAEINASDASKNKFDARYNAKMIEKGEAVAKEETLKRLEKEKAERERQQKPKLTKRKLPSDMEDLLEKDKRNEWQKQNGNQYGN